MINLGPKKKSKISKENIIGYPIKVIDSTNKKNIGLKGIIVKETKNMLEIISKGKIKKLIKNNIKISITKKEQNKKIIDGKLLLKKIEERLKSK